jgi:hypothetical protein
LTGVDREPRSTLFLSCDLVGSTNYKQTTDGWQKVFLSFYREFTQFVARANRSVQGDPSDFKLWKAIGDELIFEVSVRDERAVSRGLRVWLAAMAAYEAEVLDAEPPTGLSLKGGAFIATFPGPDSESTIPRDPSFEESDLSVVLLNEAALDAVRAHDRYLYDYFGPSIDTGFRLAAMATRRHFMLSVEVAWAVATAAHNASGVIADEELHHVTDLVLDGNHTLKGVWRGREYPVFAIDRECGDAVHEALAALGAAPLTALEVIRVCHACSESPNWIFELFLPDAANSAFTRAPHNAMLELINAESPLDGAETTVDSAPEGDQLGDSAPLGVRTLDVVAATLTPDEVDRRIPYGPILVNSLELWIYSFRNSDDASKRPTGRWYLLHDGKHDVGMVKATEGGFEGYLPGQDLTTPAKTTASTFAQAIEDLAPTG